MKSKLSPQLSHIFPRIDMQVEGFNLFFMQTGLGVLMLQLEHFLGGWRSSAITK